MQVFHNGNFISCDDTNPRFSVMAVKNGRIIFTGNNTDSLQEPFEKTDMGGKCIVPAFGDTHMHFESFALFNSGLDVRDALSIDGIGEMIRSYTEKNPGEKIILAFGTSAHTLREKRLPEREDLDRMADHPVMIVKYDGHASVANSAMIARLPEQILRTPGFVPDTGWFFQEAFYKAVNHISRSVSPARLLENLARGCNVLAEKGIGYIHTTEGVGFPLDLDFDLMRFAARGLPIDFRVFFQTMNLKKVLRRKLPRVGGCFENALDGCFGSEDAALLRPYSNNPQNRGVLFYTQDQVNEFVKEANRNHIQTALHAIGDAAVNQALTAFDAALKDHPRTDHRHIIIHGDLMDQSALEKAAELGICIAVQAPFLFWEQEPVSYLESILGDRINSLIPLRSMLDKGLVVAGGSDAPTTVPDPLFGIHCACNHPSPDQRISIEEALKMHTSETAKLAFDEETRGTLSKGKVADFVVLSEDILKVPDDTIKNIRVEDTYFRGARFEKRPEKAFRLFFNSILGRG